MKKLEQEVLRLAMLRYREWREEYGEPRPWGSHPNVPTKKAWNLLMATKRLHDALDRSRR